MKSLAPIRINREKYYQLKDLAKSVFAGCRHIAADGTPIYFPDASGHYAGCRTRDFCYMIEGAGELLPAQEILAGIDFLLAGQREDGIIPCCGPLDVSDAPSIPLPDMGAPLPDMGADDNAWTRPE